MVTSRLRGCCDNCTRSKLKCSGERPCCQRCRLRGQDCIYSKARRAGRPRLKSTKPTKQSTTASIRQQQPTPVKSYGNYPAYGLHYSGQQLPLPSPQEPAPALSGSQNSIVPLAHQSWDQSPTLSLGFTQPSNSSELGDLILHDLLLSDSDGFSSVPSGNIGLDWSSESTPFNQVLGDTHLEHDTVTNPPSSNASTTILSPHSAMTQETNHSGLLLTEVDAETHTIMANITELAGQSNSSHHVHESPCMNRWQQLLSKAQLLMYSTGAMGLSSLRLHAVLHVSWAAEQVQKHVSDCTTCMSQEIEVFSELALMYDWVTKRITYALETPSVMQSCQLTIGNSVLTERKSMIGVYELVKYRMTRAMRVIENIKSRVTSTEQRDWDDLYEVVQVLCQAVKRRLEALLGMIDLLASENS